MKYRQRNGWTHKDVIRLAHPTFPAGAEGLAYKVLGKEPKEAKPVPEIWNAFEELQALSPKNKADVNHALDLIKKYKLPWEAVPTELHNKNEIWEAMIPDMGLTALLRNLSRFARAGITTTHGLDETTKTILKRFENKIDLAQSRLHPITILNGMMVYASGRSEKGDGRWTANQKIVDGLEQAFYESFKNVEPAGKNFLLALDVSASMTVQIAKTSLTARSASCALALTTMNTEPSTHVMGFSGGFMELNISKNTRIKDALNYIDRLSFDSTDCSLPMVYAMKNKVPVDVFAVYTDSETNASRSLQPTVALEQYRQKMGRDAKLVVVGMTSNGFTIADPKDPRTLDVVGFSLDTPQAISTFARM